MDDQRHSTTGPKSNKLFKKTANFCIFVAIDTAKIDLCSVCNLCPGRINNSTWSTRSRLTITMAMGCYTHGNQLPRATLGSQNHPVMSVTLKWAPCRLWIYLRTGCGCLVVVVGWGWGLAVMPYLRTCVTHNDVFVPTACRAAT